MLPVEVRLLLLSWSRHSQPRLAGMTVTSESVVSRSLAAGACVCCWSQDIQQEIFRITGAPAYRQRLLCESEVLDPRRRLQAPAPVTQWAHKLEILERTTQIL